jgi:copper homeostasis protein
MDIIIESCVELLEEAQYAEANGANQIELCSRLDLDGLTPDLESIQQITNHLKIPVKVMIRNKPGDFIYTHEEIGSMLDEIQKIKSFNIGGFVFGALKLDEKGNHTMDLNAIFQVCKAAYPHPVTIHKCIDKCEDILVEVNSLKDIFNVKSILTSGGMSTAKEGADMLKAMNVEASGKVNIIAAGKITKANLKDLIAETGLTYYHGKKIV